MAEQLAKTTVYLEKPLLYLAKKKALEEDKTLRQILKEALSKYLSLTTSNPPTKVIKFGGYDLSKIKGNLSREEIYDCF